MSNSCEISRSLQEQDHEAIEALKSLQLLNVYDSESMREMPSSSKFSSFEQRLQEDHEALRLHAENLKSELEDLQILNERMCGEGLEAMSLRELRSLFSQAEQGKLRVENQFAKKTIERREFETMLVKQELGEEEDYNSDAAKILIRSKMDEGISRQLFFGKLRCFFREIGRGRRNSSETTKYWYSHETLLVAIKNMEREISRLQLYNMRMCGEDIDGLDFFELMMLRREISTGLVNIATWIVRKKWAKDERLGKKSRLKK